MPYDFDLIVESCKELGWRTSIRTKDVLEVELEPSVILCFVNSEKEKDCLVGFAGTPWHTHGAFLFGNSESTLEMDYVDVLLALAKGEVVICERLIEGAVKDRWLVHSKYNDELEYLDKGEEIRIRRV